MNEKEKYFIDLSKCDIWEKKQIEICTRHELVENKNYPFLIFYRGIWDQGSSSHVKNKTELTYPEFIKLFEGGEGERTELLPDVAYWRHRCLLAEKCLSVSPCDPDITEEQIKAHKDYNQYLETFGNKD